MDGLSNNQSVSFSNCAGPSIGPANQVCIQLMQTVMMARLFFPPLNIWPKDYGEEMARKQSKYEICFQNHSDFFMKSFTNRQ